MIDGRIAPNFWLSELLHSETATRLGIDNTPNIEVLANLRQITGPGIQRVRDLLGMPVMISSGYRGPELNRAIGGATKSDHMRGLAVDFTVPSFGTPLVVARRLSQYASALRYNQLIIEFGRWVHISFTAGVPKGELLTASRIGDTTVYSLGLA